MESGEDIVSRATGISKTDLGEIASQVHVNSAKLNACGYHEFVEKAGQGGKIFGKRYICARCGGEVDHHAYYWHKLGRRPQE